jgi:tetratricopeptide (TPR) repeat protein
LVLFSTGALHHTMAADIHALELEFAKNPTLETCIPLCEAYLGNKRFMEAMVVCKKGIKQAPDDPRGRILLARVYLDQGKLPKAEQELNDALGAFPGNASASETMGELLVRQGRNQEAVPFLQQAITADPSLERASSLLAQLGVAMPAAPAAQAAPPQPAHAAPAPAQPPAPIQQPPPQPGAFPPPAQNPWAGGPAPEIAPPAVLPGQAVPDGLPDPGAIGVSPPNEAQKQLEHVSDFFADDTLGFSQDASHIETAGPGRLTILGFVPKSTGSIKTTIVVALALFAIASVIVVWQYVSSENRRKIASLQSDVIDAIEEDKYPRYIDALRTAQEILSIDDSESATLAAMAYAEAVLANDHHVEGALERAKAYLQRGIEAGGENTPNMVAAKVLIAFCEKSYDEGLAEIDRVKKKGGTATVFEIEAFRLMSALKPDDIETKRQRARLSDSLTFHARGYTLLAWDAYARENWSEADRRFDEALKNSGGHPVALLGQALTDLDRNIGIEERQKEIGERIKKVHALPKEELSRPVLALAHFARAQLYQWQRKSAEADADFKKAISLDAQNPVFYLARARGLMILGQWDDAIENLRKAGVLEPNNSSIFRKMCKAYTQVGRFSDAKAACQRAEQVSGGTDYAARYLDCERLRNARRYDEAAKCHLAIPLEAGADLYAQSRIAMGKVLQQQKQWTKSINQLTDLLEKWPTGAQPERMAEAWCELGQAYEGGKNKSSALDCYRSGVEQYRFYAPCHAHVCFAGRDAEAKEGCKLYLKLAPRGELVRKVEQRLKRIR